MFNLSKRPEIKNSFIACTTLVALGGLASCSSLKDSIDDDHKPVQVHAQEPVRLRTENATFNADKSLNVITFTTPADTQTKQSLQFKFEASCVDYEDPESGQIAGDLWVTDVNSGATGLNGNEAGCEDDGKISADELTAVVRLSEIAVHNLRAQPRTDG